MRKIYYNNLLARLLLWRKDYETAMIFGFICTKRKQAQPLSSKAVNHEAIHVEQYMEVTAVALLAALMLSLAFGWGGWPFVVALLLYYIIYFVEAGISWVYNTVRRSSPRPQRRTRPITHPCSRWRRTPTREITSIFAAANRSTGSVISGKYEKVSDRGAGSAVRDYGIWLPDPSKQKIAAGAGRIPQQHRGTAERGGTLSNQKRRAGR